jgi:hypothetical protein
MEYRKLGKTGVEVSAISLGTEYLINIPRKDVVEVIHTAIGEGINYFDLFFAQEEFRDNMGFAFKDHRSEIFLTAHLGSTDQNGQYKKSRDPELSAKFFEDFLARYNTDHVDVLFLHNIDGQEDYDLIIKDGFLDLAQRYVKEGKARFIGFSGHTASTATQAVESGYIDVLMFPVNLASNAVVGKKELFNACVKNEVGLVAMKPYAGGKLLQEGNNISLKHFQTGGTEKSFEKRKQITPIKCLSYTLSQVGVSNALPGCANVKHLSEALVYFDSTDEEKDFSEIIADFQQYITGDCVYCNHCLPCPSEIDIGRTIRLFEMAQIELTHQIKTSYYSMTKNASDCIQCGSCMERCPFEVDVISKMEQTSRFFK